MDNVIKLIDILHINKDNYVIVACSGGPDSIFLLDLLDNLGYKCVCAHVNHNVREASKNEYKFLEEFCKSRNITFEGTEIKEYSKDNFHHDARNFRYQFFENLIKKYDSKYLFTAHHGDDLIETILMRIVRGSTLKGYAGFDVITDTKDYKIIRPLIYLTKEEIENRNKEKNLEYVIDESNLEDHYTRNRYRHHVLPFLKSENMDVHHKFRNFSVTLQETNDYITRIIEENINKVYRDNVLYISEFLELDEFIQKQILMKIISYWYPDELFLINDNHLLEIMKLIKSAKPNIELMLPGYVYIIKEYNKIIFTKEKRVAEDYRYELDEVVITPMGIIERVESANDTSNFCLRLNSKDIKLPIIIRSRIDGDKMEVKNMIGSKKINDIFIDEKISLHERKIYPIVTDGENRILWLPGVKKSKFDVPINGLYDIILRYEKGDECNE